jgi:hypothetical protein
MTPSVEKRCGECKWWAFSHVECGLRIGYCSVRCNEWNDQSTPCCAFDSGDYDRAVDALIVDARVLATAALAFDDAEGKEIAAITMHDIEAVEEARKAAREAAK